MSIHTKSKNILNIPRGVLDTCRNVLTIFSTIQNQKNNLNTTLNVFDILVSCGRLPAMCRRHIQLHEIKNNLYTPLDVCDACQCHAVLDNNNKRSPSVYIKELKYIPPFAQS